MSRLAPNRLSALQVKNLKDGELCDGGGLWVIARGSSKSWAFRFTSPITGKRREMGLGPLYTITLAAARMIATEARIMVSQLRDPIEERKTEAAALKREAGLSFQQVAELYITEQTPGWRDPRAGDTWRQSLSLNVFPIFGDAPVASISTAEVLAALRPIWATKTETATRVRGRIERILDYATSQGWRKGENPARWRGHLASILPKPSAVAKVQHHPAVERQDIARVMAALASAGGVASQAVRFTCLTAARSGEVRGAVWSEIDLSAKTWTVPGHRMKAGREHRIPLSKSALAVLEAVKPLRDPRAGDWVFPGQKRGNALSDVGMSKALHVAAGTKGVTVHGMRSTFRDWAAEETDYPRDVAEMALAHVIGDKVEAAYRRGDLFEKRRQMMDEWSRVTEGKTIQSSKAA